MWQYNINRCPLNCSDHGTCIYGRCFCDNGYWGLDCSNTSCPGDFCYYDPVTHVQECQHCCHAVYNYTDGDLYEHDYRKLPCDFNHPGVSTGICDGFGTCQCAPPFVGDDCSIRDCPNQCNGHGTCSLEYPTSRCICDDGWTALDCSQRLCLNNCSYPNGECIGTVCSCAPIMNPYNNTQVWAHWQGEDCSWLTPFSASHRPSPYDGGVLLAILSGLAAWMSIRA